MRRGKDGQKSMEPMFPRLHVKDTEKGGPRAPPRNKMALYEQLSIPSHRFSHSVLPGNVKNTAANSVPPMSQVEGNERSIFPSSPPPRRHPLEQQYSQYSDLSTPSARVEKRKILDDDDYIVPVFNHSTSCRDFDKFSNNMNPENFSPSNTHGSSRSQKAKETGVLDYGTRQENKKQKENNSKEFVGGWAESISYLSSIGNTEGPNKQTVSSLHHEPGDKHGDGIERLKAHESTVTDISADSQPSKDGHVIAEENMAAVARRNSFNSKKVLPLEDHTITLDSSDGSETNELERADSDSDTSILDTVSPVDITPDDVVGVIGQKHFWRARRAIANQQRVFAVQVFELHRLIEVQKLIAASPHLLLEDSAYLGKPIKVLSIKKTLVKPIPNPSKRKDKFEKPKDLKEGSAKSTAENISFSSAQNRAPPANCQPQEPPIVSSDQNTKPWSYNQPVQGRQWLVTVMSPSEGLIYKPYPRPGFMGQACGGGCGPPGSIPMTGNFFTPAYGILAAAQYQLPSYPHGYFPPYSMPIMNTAGFLGSSVEHTSHRNGTVAETVNSHVSEDIEVQASSTSSLSERVQGISAVDRRNVLPLFLTSGQVLPDCPKGVIRVVPHNAMSALESAARIFRAIQEGRKQYESV